MHMSVWRSVGRGLNVRHASQPRPGFLRLIPGWRSTYQYNFRYVRVSRADGDDFLDIDDIVEQAQDKDDARAPVADDGHSDVYVDDAEEAGAVLAYPEPPQRERRLGELLVASGCVENEGDVPDSNVVIRNIITCNSDNGGDDSLYVCVPSEGEDGGDGHDWADEAAELGAVAVLAGRPLPDCVLPVVVVSDVMRALSQVATEFYGAVLDCVLKSSVSLVMEADFCGGCIACGADSMVCAQKRVLNRSHSWMLLTLLRYASADTPASKMQTVAFIGSYGKTTSSWLTRGIFEEDEELTLMIGDTEYALAEDRLTREGSLWEPEEEDETLDRDCSVPFHIIPYKGKYEIPPTTPDGLHLQKVLAGGADRGAVSAIIELSPTLLRDERACTLKPDILVFTNAQEEKAAYDGQDFDEYLEHIGDAFDSLDPTQVAIINMDDPYAASLERLVADSGAQMLTYGVNSKNADIYAEKIKSSIWETELLVKTPVGRLEIIVPLIGQNNVSNVLAAVAVGLARGVKLVNIVAGIEAVDIIPGRSEIIEEGQPFPVIVDAAKTPEQLSHLIDEVKEAGARKTILVIGCPGTSEVTYRAAMGNMVHFKADTVFLTNDSPGVCPPDKIISDIVNGMPEEVISRHAGSYYNWLQDPQRVPQWFQSWLLRYQSEVGRYIVEDRFSAIRVAIGLAKPRDVVIVAGRGHLDYMEYWDGLSPISKPSEVMEPAGFNVGPDQDIIGGLYEDSGFSTSELDESETSTVLGWFDDRVECRNAVSKLRYLTGLKDLDRSTLPWTRYPEEREQSGLSSTVGSEAAAASGQYLGEYLRNVVDENREAARLESDDEEEEEEDLDLDFEDMDLI